eukprot:1028682-Rhodomonas_salina.1
MILPGREGGARQCDRMAVQGTRSFYMVLCGCYAMSGTPYCPVPLLCGVQYGRRACSGTETGYDATRQSWRA